MGIHVDAASGGFIAPFQEKCWLSYMTICCNTYIELLVVSCRNMFDNRLKCVYTHDVNVVWIFVMCSLRPSRTTCRRGTSACRASFPSRRAATSSARAAAGPAGSRKGTNGVSTDGVIANRMFCLQGLVGYQSVNIRQCCLPFSTTCQHSLILQRPH